MKTIIAATDFSPAATNAIHYAADMAQAIAARLLIVHISQIPIGYGDVLISTDLKEVQRLIEDKMSKTINEIKARSGTELNITSEIRMGSFFQEIRSVCEIIQPYAVVMGSQGTTAAERLILGSHTVYAMKHLPWPLITVPPIATFHTIKKIAFACDLANTTKIDLAEIKALINDFKATLHVVNTGRKDLYNPSHTFNAESIEKDLYPIKPIFHFIGTENTDNAIMDFAEQHQIDLLILIPKRHGIMERFIQRSHTKEIVLHAHVPIMALHG